MAQKVNLFNHFIDRDGNKRLLGKRDTESTEKGGYCEGYDEYKVLRYFPFTHDRKCMSVVVRDFNGGAYVYVKGSETAIKSMLRNDQRAKVKAVEVDEEAFVRKGLRTIYYGYKQL